MAFSQREVCTTAFDAFENIYQRSYSHGLEKIYALENIDVRSIRKISSPSAVRTASNSKKITKPYKQKSEQLELPFVGPFQTKLTPFIFREPIQVLGLNKRIEKWLIDQEKVCLTNLLEDDKQTLVHLKGIGQGHLDEITDKLLNYLEENSPSDESPKIDFTSWMKTFLADLDPKKCAVLLETFQLPPLTLLSPAESAEIRKLTHEKRAQWLEETTQDCCTQTKIDLIKTDLKEISDLFIKPWLRKRGGIASLSEMQDYLLKLGGLYSHTSQVLDFISDVFFDQKFPFALYLFPVEEELYCDSLETAETYHSIIQTVYTYFYNDNLHYPLDFLVRWIRYEYAKKWQGFADNFIERILRLSCKVRVRKNTSEQLTVRLS